MKKGAVIAPGDTVQIGMHKVRIYCWAGLSMEVSRNKSTRILSVKSCSPVSTPGAEDFPKTGLEELRVSSHTPVADVTRETLQVEELVLVHRVSGGDRFVALEALLCNFQCTSLTPRFAVYFLDLLAQIWLFPATSTDKAIRVVGIQAELYPLANHRFPTSGALFAHFLNIARVTHQSVIKFVKLPVHQPHMANRTLEAFSVPTSALVV